MCEVLDRNVQAKTSQFCITLVFVTKDDGGIVVDCRITPALGREIL